ncbi:hypothetical protein MaudCBS49596_005660, partial [Microsporum audouinii]
MEPSSTFTPVNPSHIDPALFAADMDAADYDSDGELTDLSGIDVDDDIFDNEADEDNESATITILPKLHLMAECGIDTHESLVSFLRGPTMLPAWRDLYLEHILPLQKEAKATGRQRPRGPSLKDVQTAIILGERDGQMRYSNPDKTEWTAVDHIALFLHRTRNLTVNHRDGIFFGKSLSPTQLDRYLWSFFTLLSGEHIPSRLHRKKGGGIALVGDLAAEAATTAGENSTAVRDSTPTTSLPTASLPATSLPTTPLAPPMSPSPQPPAMKTRKRKATPVPSTPSKKQVTDIAARQDVEMTDTPTATPTPSQRWRDEILTPSRRNALLASERRDMNNPYWKMRLLRSALHLATPIDPRPSDEDAMQDVDVDFNDTPPTSQQPSQGTQAFDNTQYLTAESIDWQLEMASDSQTPITIMPTDHSIKQFEVQQQWLDNLNYQRENVKEACRFLNIPVMTIPRMWGMRSGFTFKFWQPVAIWALWRFRMDKHLNGAILADLVGLGKTWVVIGYLLHRLFTIVNTPRPRPLCKPVLIIVPPTLVSQWEAEIQRITPKFRVVVYYGDSRAENHGVKGRLEADMPMFDGGDKCGDIIVLSSYQSFNARHGSAEKADWLREHPNARFTDGRSWRYDLSGLFGDVILDEAHTIKNLTAQTTHTILSLKADFYLCLTATPLFNSLLDFQGFQQFIFTQDADSAWDGIPEDTNPFEQHEHKHLIMTPRAMDSFVWHKNVSSSTAGARLAKVWEKCLVRRTLTSRIPFNTGAVIGEDIPATQHKVVTAAFSDAEQTRYDAITKPLYRKLMRKLPNGKLVWNMAKYRQLALLTSWLDFEYVHNTIKSNNMPAAVRYANAKRLLPKWLTLIATKTQAECDVEGMSEEEQLAAILRTSPRLRAMLPIIAEEILLYNEKSMVWTLFPAQQVLITAALRLLNIDSRVYHAALTTKERAELVREFCTSSTSAMVLVCSYSVNSAGMNLQAKCRNIHLFDTAMSEAITRQAIGRCARLGQTRIVKVYEYRVPRSFNIRQVTNNVQKAIPGMIAELNRGIFTVEGNDDGDVDLGQWAINRESGEFVK